MGFMDLKYWRLRRNSDIILYSVLKAKYFKHFDMLAAQRGYN